MTSNFTPISPGLRSFHSIQCHNVVDRGVLQAMWEELAGEVGHRDQLIVCYPRLSENALLILPAVALSLHRFTCPWPLSVSQTSGRYLRCT